MAAVSTRSSVTLLVSRWLLLELRTQMLLVLRTQPPAALREPPAAGNP